MKRMILLVTAMLSGLSPAMEYVEISGKSFSRIVMGTDHLLQGDWTKQGQPQPTDEEAFRVLDEAARLGINFFDTSPIYVGDAENRLGKWKKSRPDLKLYVLSKGGFPFDLFWAKRLEAGSHSRELKATLIKDGILASADGTALKNVPPGTYASRLYGSHEQIASRVSEELGHTLKNLNDDIAVYLMHRDDGDAVRFDEVKRDKTPVRTIMEALANPKVGNKFGLLGWSNWETERVDESVRLAKADGKLPKPVLNSPYFSLFEMADKRSIHALGVQVTHKQMMDPDFQKGIKIMPYSPLGGFSILDKPEPKWENAKADAKKKFDDGDPYWQNVYPSIFTPANEARWHRVVAFTKAFNQKHGSAWTVDQMMNAYALAHPRTDLLAIGALTIEQVRRTVASLELAKQLKPRDLDYLYSGRETRP